MAEPTSPGSAGTRKRKTAHTAAPLALHRPRSPMERLRAADAAEEDDLDNFRTHKRYLTEVMAHGLSHALNFRGAPSPVAARSGTASSTSGGGDGPASMEVCASPTGTTAEPPPWQRQQQQTQQPLPSWQQQTAPGTGPQAAVAALEPAPVLHWPPRWQEPCSIPPAPFTMAVGRDPPQQTHHEVQQQAVAQPATAPRPDAPPLACAEGQEPPPREARSGAADMSQAATGSPPEGLTASRVDLRRMTLMRSLLHRTEEHLRVQATVQAPNEACGCDGADTLVGALPATAAATAQQPQLPPQFATMRCSTPISSDGSIGGGGAASPQSPVSCEMATSSCGATHAEDACRGGGACGGGGSGGGGEPRQLSWLLPFRQLSVTRPPQPPKQAAGNHQPPRPRQQHQQQQGRESQQGQQKPPCPELSRDKLMRLRAKALQEAAAQPDLDDGCGPSKPGRRASADARDCGERWQIAAWPGAGGGSGGGAAAAAAANAAARRWSSHL